MIILMVIIGVHGICIDGLARYLNCTKISNISPNQTKLVLFTINSCLLFLVKTQSNINIWFHFILTNAYLRIDFYRDALFYPYYFIFYFCGDTI